MALIKEMAENFKGISKVDILKDVAPNETWDSVASKLEKAVNGKGWSKLCLPNSDPDTRAEDGWFSYSSWGDNPQVEVQMDLKWGPSFQVGSFCSSLEKGKYGFATINGGEYMCAMGDEIAYVEWEDSIDGTWNGPLDLKEYRKLVEDWQGKQPANLHEKALKALIEDVDESTYFWSCWDEDYDEDEGEE